MKRKYNRSNADLKLADLSFLSSFSKTYGIDQNAKDKLALNLNRIWLGNKDIYRSPFAKDLSTSTLFENFYSEVFKPNTNKINKVLTDFENEQASKFSPRSLAKPWVEWRDQFYSTYDIKISSFDFKDDLEEYQNRLRPLSIQNASSFIRRSTTASLPTMMRKGLVLERTVNEYTYSDAFKYPSVLYTRTQENNKIRGVWGYPLLTTLLEASYFYPLLSIRKKYLWRSALRGPDDTSSNITRLINKANKLGFVCLSIDFSNFDASISPVLCDRAFSNFARQFQSKYKGVWNDLSSHFSSIEIVTPDGLISGEHGVGSGSNFTNEVDSEIHKELIMSSNVVSYNDFDIQGDDGAIILDEGKLSSLYRTFEKAGLQLNKDKSYTSPDYFIYLQKLHHKDYQDDRGKMNGIYSIFRCLNRIVFQENWSNFEDYEISGQDFYSIRTISILENCRYHPLFEEIVKFVVKYDKYSLAYSKQGLIKYVKMINETEGNRRDFTNQYGDNINGLSNFETVKLIRRLTS